MGIWSDSTSSFGSDFYGTVYRAFDALGEPWHAVLLGSAVKGALLLAAAGLVTSCLRNAAFRHLVWVLALGSALLLPLLGMLLPGLDLPVPPKNLLAPVQIEDSSAISESSKPPSSSATDDGPVGTPRVSTASSPSLAAAGPETLLPSPRSLPSWSAVVMSAWATGFILLLVPLVRGIRQRQVLARSALPVESEAWNEQLAELTERLAARRAPRLLISPKITVPMTWGSLRPVILLPEDADCWPASRRRDVLLHELAHIRRHDALTRIWSQLACALYWFDPLVWWAAHRLRVESEHACDDRVLSAGSRASDYADHLLAAARTARDRLPVAAVAMARPSPLSGRVFAILDEKRDRAPLTATRLLVSCLTASVLALPLAAAAPQPPEPPAAPEAPEPETAPVAPRAPKAPLPPEAPRTYLEELLEQAEPSTGELARALRLAGSEIGSDHELSELLRLVSSRELDDRGALLAYVLATRSIGSDHALARALQLLLERELEAEVLDAVLTSASTIGSDHELAELLIELTARGIEPTETFFEVLDTVDSEHERERVLATIGE